MTYPNSRVDFIDMISNEFDGNPNYENVNIKMEWDGLTVTYDLKEVPDPDPILMEQLRAIFKNCTITKVPELTSRHQKEFFPFPEIKRKLPIRLP